MDPETVLAALFAWLVANTTGFRTTGRRVKPWTEVSAQPALYLRHTGSTDEYRGQMPVTTLECEAWIYSKAGQNPDAVPDTSLNTMVQQVRGALAPDQDGRFTLGGLVYWCRIEGRTHSTPGDLGDQAIALVPIRVTLPMAPPGSLYP